MSKKFYKPEDLLEASDTSVLIDSYGWAWQVSFPELFPCSADDEPAIIPDGLEDYPGFPFTLVFDGDDPEGLLDNDNQ